MERKVWIDWLRVAACFMVFVVHSTEPFYLGGQGSLILDETDAFWASFFDTLVRACVPLFVIASSYLMFPLNCSTGEFFKKRAIRILIPFILWSVVYAFVWGEPVENFKNLLLNFNYAAGHLWFIYMLLGVYLLMPLLSPWAEKVSRKEERAFLLIWAFTTILPFFRPAAMDATGSPDLWGECPWNGFGSFYYVSGFIGYLVLGHYLRTHVKELSWKKTLTVAVPFWIAGYAVTAGGFWKLMPKDAGFPISAPYETAVMMETTWNFCTFGVMMQTVAYFLLIRKITSSGWGYRHIIYPVSGLSYGIYLMHMFILTPVSAWVRSWGMATPLTMISAAAITYIIGIIITRLISFVPKSKYLIG